MDNKWVQNGNDFSFGSLPKISDTLSSGVYELKESKFGFFLSLVSDEFTLPEKIYDNESALISRVETTFKGFDKNFGILLKGIKGGGKTITAKQICNNLKLPVILVNEHYDNMGSFINSISQDVILFFDEFEKTYSLSSYQQDDEEINGKKSIANLLTLMDGVFTSGHKRLFILTTNEDYLPDAIMSRPSRIRYSKDFTDLPLDSIMLILEDSVKNKSLIPGLVALLKELEIVTVDIVKSFAEEANLYGKVDKDFFSIFNVKRIEQKNSLISEDNKEVICETFKMIPKVGFSFYGDNDMAYYIVNTESKNKFTVVENINWKGSAYKYDAKELKVVNIVKSTPHHRSFSPTLDMVI